MVVGSGGSGKSTFADALGERTGLPVVHLDRHFWRPGWVETPRDEWRAVQAEMVAADEWILDGNYSSTIDVRLTRADTMILLDLSRWRCLGRILIRTLRQLGEDITAPGCPDRFEWEFTRWVWSYPDRSRPKILAAAERRATELDFVRLRGPSEVRKFLDDLHTRPVGDGR
jgi:adenylate kinase family enzyme